MSEEAIKIDESVEVKEELEIKEEELKEEEIKAENIEEACKVDEEHNPEEDQKCEEKMEDSDDEPEVPEDHDSDNKDEQDKDCDEENHDEEKMSEEDTITFEQLKEENEKLKKDNEAYMAKIEEMSDYEDLKQFKADTLEKEAKMAEAVEMAKVMKSLEDKGVKMSEDIKSELTQQRDNFANTSAWANYVKAYVFDNCEISNTDDGIIKFDALDAVKENQNSEPDNIWASLKNKFSK